MTTHQAGNHDGNLGESCLRSIGRSERSSVYIDTPTLEVNCVATKATYYKLDECLGTRTMQRKSSSLRFSSIIVP